jgi:hypothetical protein
MKTLTMALLGLLLLSQGLQAQPVRDKILGEVDISRGPKGTSIQVMFTFPVRYIKHFPYEKGDELRIKFRPIAISPTDRDALFKRESVTPPRDNPVDLSQIIYEGDIEGGPFLTLIFQHPVKFTVSQGTDFRSITILIPDPADTTTCPPNNKSEKDE